MDLAVYCLKLIGTLSPLSQASRIFLIHLGNRAWGRNELFHFSRKKIAHLGYFSPKSVFLGKNNPDVQFFYPPH